MRYFYLKGGRPAGVSATSRTFWASKIDKYDAIIKNELYGSPSVRGIQSGKLCRATKRSDNFEIEDDSLQRVVSMICSGLCSDPSFQSCLRF